MPDEATGEHVLDGWHCLWKGAAAALATKTYVPVLPELDDPMHRDAAADFCVGLLRGWERVPAVLEKVEADATANAQLDVLRRLAAPAASVEAAAAGRRALAPVIAAAIRVTYAATAALRPAPSEAV
jgi:hypothetical protein